MGLGHERLGWTTAVLDPDLRSALGDIVTDDPIGHPGRIVLIDQSVEDPPGGMALLAWRVQV